jgi:hypothetical protein
MDLFAHGPPDQICRALGEAVVKRWGRLPQHVQRFLFEEAVRSHGEHIRSRLAAVLHHTHPRTGDRVKARAMLEPDNLGG